MQLTLQDITCSYGKTPVLQGVSFAIQNGSFVSILGASGAGKSTILNVIAGLTPHQQGHIYFDGRQIDSLPAHKRNVSMVFQDHRLFPHMSVGENIAFPLKMRGASKAERQQRVSDLLKSVQLAGFEGRKIYELSGGQQQRVALARALSAKPQALLLDEPFSGLNEELRADMRQLVLQLHDQFGMTTILVTHDLDEALMMSDAIMYLDQGVISQHGTPRDFLFASGNAQFSGTSLFARTTLLEGTVKGGVFSAGAFTLEANGTPDGAALLVRIGDNAPQIIPASSKDV